MNVLWEEQVLQLIGPGTGRWWVRDDTGTLWVWCRWWDARRTRRTGSHYMRMWLPEPAPVPEWEDREHPHRIYQGSVHPSRITCALDLGFEGEGLEGPEVDEALGVATTDDSVVDAWEAGERAPTHVEVLRLATLTGYHPKWFYAPAMPASSPAWFCGDDAAARSSRAAT